MRVLFQSVLLIRIIHTDYSDIYRAFQIGSSGHIESLYHFFGPIPLLFAGVGAFIGLASPTQRRATIFIISNMVLLYCFFTRTQAFGQHHYLPLAFWSFALGAIAIGWLIERTNYRVSAGLGISAAFAAIFVGNFFPFPHWAQRSIGWALPEAKSYRLKMSSQYNYGELLADVKRLTARGDKLSVFGYGYDGYDDIVSDELFYALTRQQSKGWLVRTAHIDKRDNLQIEPLLSRYAVIGDPLTLEDREHPALPPWPPIKMRFSQVPLQQVEVALAERIRESRGIGAAYRRLPKTYKISDEVTAYIYEKVRPFTSEEIEELLAHFFRVYPEWEGNYRFARILLGADVSLLDAHSRIELELPDNLKIWAGTSLASHLSLSSAAMGSEVKGFLIAAQKKWFACSKQFGLSAVVEVGSKKVWEGILSSAEVPVFFEGNNNAGVSLTIGRAPHPDCEYLSVRPIFSNPSDHH